MLFDKLLSSSGIVEKSSKDGEMDLVGKKLVRLFVLSLISADSNGFFPPLLIMHGSELMVTFFSGDR